MSGESFAEIFGADGKVVIDLGGLDVNGSLREYFEKRGMKYISVDMEQHPSVDVVAQPGQKLPFDDASVDMVVSTSCFEHDPMFWMTFKEITRIVKPDGFIYLNAPSYGPYHGYPGDCWRFYSDAGQALAFWSGIQMSTEKVHPVKVLETFHNQPSKNSWIDWVCVFQRTEEKQTDIKTSEKVLNTIGKLEASLNSKKLVTFKRMNY